MNSAAIIFAICAALGLLVLALRWLGLRLGEHMIKSVDESPFLRHEMSAERRAVARTLRKLRKVRVGRIQFSVLVYLALAVLCALLARS